MVGLVFLGCLLVVFWVWFLVFEIIFICLEVFSVLCGRGFSYPCTNTHTPIINQSYPLPSHICFVFRFFCVFVLGLCFCFKGLCVIVCLLVGFLCVFQ